MIYQNTVKREISFSGVGIHSGKNIQLRLKPSEAGEVIFRRTDLDDMVFRIDPQAVVTRNSSISKPLNT